MREFARIEASDIVPDLPGFDTPEFWCAWIHSELPPHVQADVRHRARRNEQIRRDLASLEGQNAEGSPCVADALERLGTVLRASGFQVTDDDPADDLTPKAGGQHGAAVALEARRAMKPAVLLLLKAVLGDSVPSNANQWELTETLFGAESFVAYDRMVAVVQSCRQEARRKPRPHALCRVIQALAPNLFGLSLHLSCRLWVRSRMQGYCLDRRWKPQTGTLSQAIRALTRRKMGEIIARSNPAVGAQYLEGYTRFSADR